MNFQKDSFTKDVSRYKPSTGKYCRGVEYEPLFFDESIDDTATGKKVREQRDSQMTNQ